MRRIFLLLTVMVVVAALLIGCESDRRSPCGEFTAVRIFGGDKQRHGHAVHYEGIIHQHDGISRNRPDSFQHRLSQVNVTSLDASVNYGIGNFGEVDENTVSTFNFGVLYERRDFVYENDFVLRCCCVSCCWLFRLLEERKRFCLS